MHLLSNIGQSDLFIQYIDPDSRTVRSYYPDFVFLREEPEGIEKYVIVEVKADNQIDDAVVQAKNGLHSTYCGGQRDGVSDHQVNGR